MLKNKIFNDGITCQLTSSCIAGMVAAFFGSPVEVIKTRIMSSSKGQYSGPLDCAIKTVRNEGFTALYKGFWPYAVRQMTWICVMFITLE